MKGRINFHMCSLFLLCSTFRFYINVPENTGASDFMQDERI